MVMSRFARRPETPNPLDAPAEKAAIPLGEMLIGRGATTPGAVRAALRRQRRDKRRIGELLVDAGVREGEVVAALAEQLGYKSVDLEKVTPEQ
jgi:hypothetical protein